MTAVTSHLASPTAAERALLRLATALIAAIRHRRELRAESRRHELELLQQSRTRAKDPRALDIALLAIGSRPRP
ncbi:hypothetical protein L2X99_13510 [Microbacterium sp. KUDC0406]|uniref:hypothetical protein n=1 Tax=Microbacterium sp. KUDC0406 TaxID=2909588 RepID=UPI001F3BFDD8|nr:hypothetical protein [Microbacterium sp. KUDC0406]UJP09436.1 hypothetical protein L2X99_13510 [Microbacterium sp. KUDC0406]